MPKRKNNLVKMQAAQKLLGWYDRHRRVLPWRALPGETPDPYCVWLSEIMLQQTTVVTVKPYYEKFLTLFPTLHDLAAAPDDAVMTAWAGLGYYSRARNLLKCARTLVAEHNGIFPQEESALLTLPGIGPYTAAAIAAIAFNQQAAPVDGNIERVLARLLALTTPLPKLKAEVKTFAAQLLEPDAPHTRPLDNRPGDIAQAMMDLGATICKPKRPNCLLCPWQEDCAAKRQGIEETLPRRAPKKPKPERQGTVWWLENEKGEVLMHRRPEKGLLGGVMMLPSAGWDPDNDSTLRDILPHDWTPLAGSVVHVFTHFRLTLRVERLILTPVTLTPLAGAPPRFEPPAAHMWVHPKDFHDTALPSVMRKVVTHVLG